MIGHRPVRFPPVCFVSDIYVCNMYVFRYVSIFFSNFLKATLSLGIFFLSCVTAEITKIYETDKKNAKTQNNKVFPLVGFEPIKFGEEARSVATV